MHARANPGRLIELFGVLQVGHYAIPETVKGNASKFLWPPRVRGIAHICASGMADDQRIDSAWASLGNKGDQFMGRAQAGPARKRKTQNRSRGSVELTARHRQVATLVSRGLSNREIAEKLGVTEGTIKLHVHAICKKLNIHSRTKLAIALISRGHSRRLKI